MGAFKDLFGELHIIVGELEAEGHKLAARLKNAVGKLVGDTEVEVKADAEKVVHDAEAAAAPVATEATHDAEAVVKDAATGAEQAAATEEKPA